MLTESLLVAGRFRVIEHAASGGMGSVYKALDLKSGEPVALKIAHGAATGDQRQRLVRESDVLASLLPPLEHFCIVRYIAHGQLDSGEPYLAMEWLEGPNLSEFIATSTLSPWQTIELGIRLSTALAAMHAKGVVHRDIKPGNIILVQGRIERATLVDFGLVHLEAHKGDLTEFGMMVGTPNFVAPEQARGIDDIGPAVDLYSLGAVLYTCLTGRPPFFGAHVMAVLAKLLLEPAPLVRKLCPSAPKGLETLINLLMAKSPEERPGSAESVKDALCLLRDANEVDEASRSFIAISSAEQRYVSLVLVGRGAGATMLGAQPRLARLAQDHHANIERLADGTRIAVLTSGSAPVEAAIRAARLSLEIHLANPLTPIVVATGRSTESDAGLVGEVIDRAVSLLLGDDETPQATPGAGLTLCDIKVCEVTARLIEQRFQLLPAQQDSHILLAEKTRPSAARTLLGKPTRFIGRERECATLERIFDECASLPATRVVRVIGSPGSGKSTVAREFVGRLRERDGALTVWTAFGDSMRVGSPLGLLAQLIRRALGLVHSDPPLEQRACLQREIAGRLPVEAADRVTVFLGEILGIGFSETGRIQLREARANARLMHDQMRRAWEDWLQAGCMRHPVLCVLEDLHWADRATMQFMLAAVRHLSNLPLMLLILCRPEASERFPDICTDHDHEAIWLQPLSESACLAIAQEALGDPSTRETAELLAKRCDGNPFFLEELLRSAAADETIEPPGTVLATIAARLHSLPPEQRRILRAASVYGRRFWLDGVTTLLGGSADSLSSHLSQLIEQELISAANGSRLSGQIECFFCHELTRDAAYATLVDDDRVNAHRMAGEWLEQAGETESIILAEHYWRGRAMQKALPWFHRAATQALEANDSSGALENIERAMTCGAQGEVLGSLRLLQAEIHNWNGEHELASQCAREALQLLPGDGDDWADAAHHLVWAGGNLAAYDELEALSERITENMAGPTNWKHLTAVMWCVAQLTGGGRIQTARRLRQFVAEAIQGCAMPDSIAATLADVDGFVADMSGRPDRAAKLFMKASEHWQAVGNQRNACLSRSNASDDFLRLGLYDVVVRSQSELLSISQRLGADYLVGDIKYTLARSLIHLGRARDAEEILCEAMTDTALDFLRPFYAASLSAALFARGEHRAALDEARRAASSAEVHPRVAVLLVALQTRALLALGEPEQALAVVSRGMESVDALDVVHAGDISLRLAHAEALYACGKHGQARTALEAARSRLLARAQRIESWEWRLSFLDNIAENRRTLQLAREWGAEELPGGA